MAEGRGHPSAVHTLTCTHPPAPRAHSSASRIGESDGNANRKRIKALREALQKKGWVSVGF